MSRPDERNHTTESSAWTAESNINTPSPADPDSTKKLIWIGACSPTGRDDPKGDDPTVVRVRVPEGRHPWLTFMIDNGAAVNLIKSARWTQEPW